MPPAPATSVPSLRRFPWGTVYQLAGLAADALVGGLPLAADVVGLAVRVLVFVRRGRAGRLVPARRAQQLEQPAAQEDLALLRGEVVRERQFVARVLYADRDLVAARLELLAHLGQRPALADLGAVVVGGVLERQREDALRDEVAPVDAREGLREDGTDAEVQRRDRGMLARGALAVVLATDDEACAPLLHPLAELRVAVAERELGDRGDVR